MDADFHRSNRRKLFDTLDVHVCIFAGNILVQRSNDASYPFEQEANFWYLTGIDAPGWRVIIQKDTTTLVMPDVDEVHEVFDGSLSAKDAIVMSGADEVLTQVQAKKLLEGLRRSNIQVATLGDDPHKDRYDFSLNPGPVIMREELTESFGELLDCRKHLAEMRAIKQSVEIDALRRAIAVTVEAFEAVKLKMDHYKYEYEIEADFSHSFRAKGATGHAYDPIIAMSKNACTLHYHKNNEQLSDGQLVLMDVGARHTGYAADITRTYAFGSITDRQKAVHAAVDRAHHDIIDLLRPGLLVKDYFNKVDVIMQHALQDLGLLKNKTDYRKYFPHSISHGLGIDVHDSLGGPVTFQAGMVVTVEPGIYIPEEAIGVRIEDDILITESGYENLSARLSTAL